MTGFLQSKAFDPGRPAHDLVMREEFHRILKHPSFRNAPVLSRLLRFLVDETVAGRAHALKSYSVAIDGLGKSEDFDSNSDSYPRVQVGRLRRALANYYAEHAPQNGLCLYLQLGSYRLRLGSPATAYPNLYRPLSAHQIAGAAMPLEAREGSSPPAAYGKQTGWLVRLASAKLHLFVAAAFIAIVVLGSYELHRAVTTFCLS